jgi:hypothetical protein
VPRALWPDKPDVAGSGTLVSEYTGLTFAEGTSVGVGHVLEAYINFGPLGVLVVFVVIGGILVWVERAAASCLNRGDGLRFALWYAPGLSLLNVGGSLSEFVATAAAAFLVAGGVTAIALLVRAEEPARPPAAGHGLAPAGARSSAIDR